MFLRLLFRYLRGYGYINWHLPKNAYYFLLQYCLLIFYLLQWLKHYCYYWMRYSYYHPAAVTEQNHPDAVTEHSPLKEYPIVRYFVVQRSAITIWCTMPSLIN